jgi:hypothetical membrane protein
MTELARLDIVRGRSGPDHVVAGAASLVAELPRAAQVGLRTFSAILPVSVSRPVPRWVVVSALLTPVLLVTGWLIGGALQPASYSPMRETVSALAGQTGADPWIMTGALFLVGATQIATGAGIGGVRLPARILLILTGLSTFGVAASPEPAAGPTLLHLAFAVSCVLTTAIWPIFVARRVAPSWIVSQSGCAIVAVFYAGLCGWLLFATFGGGSLGLAERLTSAALGIFPLIVAVALRHAGWKRW